MKLIVASDRRFFIQADGSPCCADGSRGYGFWSRYLDVFDSVEVVARFDRKTEKVGFPVEGDRVSLIPLQNYVGPRQYFQNRLTLHKQISAACQVKAAYLLRVPGYVGTMMQKCLTSLGRSYSLEVVADPDTLFSPGTCDHPLRPLIRWDSIRRLRKQCRLSSFSAYVTKKALQASYPPGPTTIATGCSDVEMPDKAFVTAPRQNLHNKKCFTIITIGSLAQLYKAPHILISAFEKVHKSIPNSNLVFIGDGKHQLDLEHLCQEKNLSRSVKFLGRLPAGECIREQLDKSDLFVLPSLSEGLPRALIEAMGRGLPCIASDVGGIPELLEPSSMVPAGQVDPLAKKILEMLNAPSRMAYESQRNLDVAARYRADLLSHQWRDFYQQILDYNKPLVKHNAA